MPDNRQFEGVLADFEHALETAVSQGLLEGQRDGIFQWQAVINVEGRPDPYFAVLTVGRVGVDAARKIVKAKAERAGKRS
jgi:hypothetical protein